MGEKLKKTIKSYPKFLEKRIERNIKFEEYRFQIVVYIERILILSSNFVEAFFSHVRSDTEYKYPDSLIHKILSA